MKPIHLFSLIGISGACFAFACSSSNDRRTVAGDDGSEAGAALPPSSGGVDDAATSDVMAPDAGPSARLEVTCAEEPCYVAVSGQGSEHVCGLLSDGTVRCWGRDTRIQPAANDVDTDAPAPVADGALGRGRTLRAWRPQRPHRSSA